jgi:restriction endonuclease Mrr
MSKSRMNVPVIQQASGLPQVHRQRKNQHNNVGQRHVRHSVIRHSDALRDRLYCHRNQPENKQKQHVRDRVLNKLLSLNVPQFEMCIARLLHALNYEDVHIMRRIVSQRRSHKGRNSHGGYDLCAHSSSFSSMRTLVQVKQYQRPVSRRFVDELRGAMIRQGAQQGLLITTSLFPDAARMSAHENALLPICLIDGEGLLDLLFRYELGVKCRRGKSGLLWRIDRVFFRDLLPLSS